jgi:hypothetical protein
MTMARDMSLRFANPFMRRYIVAEGRREKMALHMLFRSAYFIRLFTRRAPSYRSRPEICSVTRYEGQFRAPYTGLDTSQSLRENTPLQKYIFLRASLPSR